MLTLSTLPQELLIQIASTPRDICLLIQVNKRLNEVLSEDQVWKPLFYYYRRYAYRKKDHISYKVATLGINHARYSYAFFHY